MTEIRNVAADASRLRLRVLAVGLVVFLAFCLIVARLVFLQVVRHEDLAAQAESNRTAVVPIVPNRGLILDRNGVVLATNYAAYTLEITPSRAAPPSPCATRARSAASHSPATLRLSVHTSSSAALGFCFNSALRCRSARA